MSHLDERYSIAAWLCPDSVIELTVISSLSLPSSITAYSHGCSSEIYRIIPNKSTQLLLKI